MAVVKADAYGHGAVAVARALEQEGVEAFAVATMPEALALREAGLQGQILVFAVPQPAFLDAYVRYDLDVSVPTVEAARLVAESGLPLRVHLKIDTGMHRLGIPPEAAPDVIPSLQQSKAQLATLWTHFAMADPAEGAFTAAQVERFRAVRALAPEVPVHLANSYALLSGQGMVEDAAFVRGGVAVYGLLDAETRRTHDLREAMCFETRIVALQTVGAGEGVSYSWTWRAPEPTHVATIAAGYADGVRRALSNRGEVGIAGRRYPIVGNVCMDACLVALGPASEPCPVAIGETVVLFGPGGPSAFEVAQTLGTIAYEVACGVGSRVPRIYS